MPTPEPETASLIGKLIDNRFQVTAILGKGANGTVYQATDLELNYDVALKVLGPRLDEATLARIKRGAEAAHGLAHPNVVRVYAFNKSPAGFSYLVTDCVQGRNLSDILADDPRLPEDRSTQIFTQVCDAIEHAHAKGVVHGNLKPSNILIVETSGQNDLVKVLDFGLARTIGEGENSRKTPAPEALSSSVYYWGPEQCMGNRLDGRADIYSVGALLFHCLTGQRPFAETSPLQVLSRQIKEPLPPMAACVPELKYASQLTTIINRATAKQCDERYQSAGEMRHDLSMLPQVATQEWKTRAVACRPPEQFKARVPVGAAAYVFDWKPVLAALSIMLIPVLAMTVVALADWQIAPLAPLKLAVQEAILPANDPRLLHTLNYLSQISKAQGHYADAYAFKAKVQAATAQPVDTNKDAEILRQKFH